MADFVTRLALHRAGPLTRERVLGWGIAVPRRSITDRVTDTLLILAAGLSLVAGIGILTLFAALAVLGATYLVPASFVVAVLLLATGVLAWTKHKRGDKPPSGASEQPMPFQGDTE